VLSPITPIESPSSAKPLSIEISTVHLPQYLDRPHIVTRSGNNRLKVLQGHQWGGNLRKDMVRILAVNLSQLLNTPNVSIAPHRSSTQADYRISIEIIKFEKDSDNKVRLSAHWRITNGKTGKIAAVRITDLESDALPPASNYADTVTTMAALYGQLGRIIADTIIQVKDNTAA